MPNITRKTPTSESRRRLDHEQVLRAAEAIVDRDGWQHLTMTLLASELGVKVPSLYNHVPNLEALRAELQVRTMAALGTELRTAAMGKSEEKAYRAIASAFHDFARRHPSRYELATDELLDPPAFGAAATDAMAAITAVIESFGIESSDDFEVELTTFAALHGVVALENSGFFRGIIDADAIFERTLQLALQLIDDSRPPEAKTA